MEFTPINGQRVSACSELRLGLCRLKTNGCAIVALYNALGFLGCQMSLNEILRFFRAWYRPHLFGILPGRIRAFFRREGIPFSRNATAWKGGDIAVITYWNRSLWRKIINPFAGAHTVCVRWHNGFWVYNRFSNRAQAYRYETPEEFLHGRKIIQILQCKPKTDK